jgi:glutamate synthase domain-containing protein 3
MTGGTVVVLGATGRNFAAGMSGGVAYVLDESGDFAKYCNPSMVSLDPLLSESEQEARLPRDLWHKGESDEAIARRLIENHARYTGSEKAKRILAGWSDYRAKFVKVFPNEYRRALGELAAKTKRKAA